jgi:hypothetical protein
MSNSNSNFSSNSQQSNSNLHQRRPYNNNYIYSNVNTVNTNSQSHTHTSTNISNKNFDTISSSTLLKSNPTHHQKVYKLKIPFLYKFTPTSILNILNVIVNCLCLNRLCCGGGGGGFFCIRLKPYWVERYMILVGNYLYKFQPVKHGHIGHNEKMKMKGSPIPLETMSLSSLKQLSQQGGRFVAIDTVTDINSNRRPTENYIESTIPSHMNCNGYFSITSSSASSFSKTTYYATESQLDAHTWVNILHNAKNECIKIKMGHSNVPMDKNVEYANILGKRVLERKKRIKDMIRKREREEVELMCMYGNTHQPRGYFG